MMILIAVVLLGLATGGWYWWQPRPVNITLPQDISSAELKTALEKARLLVEQEPRSAEAWGNLGMILQANGYIHESHHFFAEAQRLSPENGRWPYLRALAYQGEDVEKALPLLEQANSLRFPDESQHSAVRLRYAEALLERQNLVAAESLYQTELEKHPGDFRASFGMGVIVQSRGEVAKAENYYLRARTSPTVRKAATAQLAMLARSRGDTTAARTWEAEAAKFPDEAPPWPDPILEEMKRKRLNPPTLAQTAVQYETQGRYAEAAKAYHQLLQTDPSARNYTGAGMNSLLSGQLELGLKLLRQAVTIDPFRSESQFALSQGLFQIASMQRDQNPNMRTHRDKFTEAATAARTAAELRPENAQAYLLWGQSLMALEEWSAAVSALRKGVAIRPELFSLQLALGQALLESGQYREAESQLLNAQKINPHHDKLKLAFEKLKKLKQ